MPVDSIEWIAATFAFAALTVSLLSLWYTSLKGPDIVLCEAPRFSERKTSSDIFDSFIPYELHSEAHLLFLNNGTVSGVLRLEPHFEPTTELKPFFNKANFSFVVADTIHEATIPPISMREKESCMVVVRVSLEFVNWKKHFANEPLSKDAIRNVLLSADLKNKQQFHDFCAVLKPGMHIGGLNIESTQTVRSGLSGTKMTHKNLVADLSVGIIDEELVRNYRFSATKWDAIDPSAILTELGAIHDDFGRMLLDPAEQNLGKLIGVTEPGTLETDLFRAMKRRLEGHGSRAAITEFVMRSSGLDSRLVKYDANTREWNRTFNLYKENPSNKRLEETLLNDKKPLEEESAAIVAEVRQVRHILRECYLPNP
jgi:hypothetical protein